MRATARTSTSLPPGLGAGGPGYGLSTNPGIAFEDHRLKQADGANWLGLKRARLIVRWDVAVPQNERGANWPAYDSGLAQRTEDWFVNATRAGFTRFLVSFDGGGTSHRPTTTEYKKAVRAFVTQFGDRYLVGEYTAWNEPNHASQPVSSQKAGSEGARYAGFYFKLMSRMCDEDIDPGAAVDKRCMVIAGDFAEPVSRSYFDRYVQYAGYRPRAWAYHIYETGWRRYDSNGNRTNTGANHSAKLVDWFLKATATKAEQNPSGSTSAPPVWLTEQGPRYDKYRKYFPNSTTEFKDARAVEDVRHMLNVVRGRSRIRRFNYYAWYGFAAGFDSGFVQPTDCALRPHYYTYKSRTNPNTPNPDPTPPTSFACPY